MKIADIKISNLFTFPYVSNFSAKKWLIFDSREKWNFNILIGPNWSGKTNFIYIINKIFRNVLIKKYIYDRNILETWKNNKFKDVIKYKKLDVKWLLKHSSFENKKSKVWITFKLNQYDYENIWFVCKYNNFINWIIKKYSNLDFSFDNYNIYDAIFENKIYLEFLIDTKKWEVEIANYDKLSKRERFILYYMQNIELIQISMNIYNDFIRKSGEKKMYPLKNTFALIESERNIFELSLENSFEFKLDSVRERSNYVEKYGFDNLASANVWYNLFLIKVIKDAKENLLNKGKDYYKQTFIKKSEFIKSWISFSMVSKYINKLLKLKLDIKILENKYMYLIFVDKSWTEFDFNSLSSGEKSVVLIVFSLFWYDLSNGLFIIDEPELHLHPYMLKKLINLINEIWNNMDIQFVFATHSPLLIDEKNIKNVYKFSMKWSDTEICHPWLKINDRESTLIHILKTENVSKIFFMNKIIMVEWDTDEYFWRYFLEYLDQKSDFKFDDYEILNIHGKWSYKKRSNFIKKFGIESYFIWDWDNTIENNIIDYDEMSEYINLVKKNSTTNNISKKRFYVRIIDAIKNHFPDKYEYIQRRIKFFYSKWIFIFKEWDLETYLWLKKKWLDQTIKFCNSDFKNWIKNEEYSLYISELYDIVEKIFGKNLNLKKD